MAAYIAIILSSISTILFFIILVKFKKLFSTESIIEKTKKQMNKIIVDINKNTNMDIDLINEATKRTRNLINEVDEKMAQFRKETEDFENAVSSIGVQKVANEKKKTVYKNSLINEIKPISEFQTLEVSNKKNIGKANSLKAKAYKNDKQQSLFDDESPRENSSSKSGRNNFVADKDVDSYDDGDIIPNIVTNITPPDNFVSETTTKDKIKEMALLGMDADDIAEELSYPVSEVQFIIDMLNN